MDTIVGTAASNTAATSMGPGGTNPAAIGNNLRQQRSRHTSYNHLAPWNRAGFIILVRARSLEGAHRHEQESLESVGVK
jgi:hypothetical protein